LWGGDARGLVCFGEVLFCGVGGWGVFLGVWLGLTPWATAGSGGQDGLVLCAQAD